MTDRKILRIADLDAVDFGEEGGLVPVVVQDAASGDALMLGYANRTALETTLETGEMHFWSRSRGELWRKGATSGNTLALESLHLDCDGDAILARVSPAGPTCHTGERSCFGEGIHRNVRVVAEPGTLERLDATLASRAAERPEGSYTVRLLDDENVRLKKLGEESAELIAALAKGDGARAIEEAADVVYHVLVALRAEGVGVAALLDELDGRSG